MKLSHTEKHRRKGPRVVVAGLMLLLWAWMCAVEVSPELHSFVHKDAQNPTHNCLVTQFQHHSLHPGAAPAILPAAPTNWTALVTHTCFFLPASFDYRLSPSRAPPLA